MNKNKIDDDIKKIEGITVEHLCAIRFVCRPSKKTTGRVTRDLRYI